MRDNRVSYRLRQGHQKPKPRLAANLLKVFIFLKPRSLQDSENDVCPSKVLVTIARAKRWLTRAPRVR